MQVRLARTIRPAEYESFTFDLTLTEADVPAFEGESMSKHVARMHLECQRQLLAWMMFHGQLSSKEASDEVARFKKLYKLDGGEAKSDGGQATGGGQRRAA